LQRRPRFSIALVAALLLALPGSAQAVLIDEFDVDQSAVIPLGGSNPATSSIVSATAGVLGGFRAGVLTRTVGLGGMSYDSNISTPGLGDLSLGASTDGTFLLIYDGDLDFVVDPDGLSENLQAAGESLFSITLRSDLVADLTLTVYSSATDFSTFEFTSPGLGLDPTAFTTILIPFASFAPTGSGADFEDVGAVTLEVDGVLGLDLQIDRIETVVPEPTTLVLGSLGLAGLAVASRRRRS
jgi:hypothetical protein